MDLRIDKVDTTIVQILKLLQPDKASNLNQSQNGTETRISESSGKVAQILVLAI